MKHSFIFSSNSVRLFGKDWVAIITILIGIFYLLPKCWPLLEKFNPPLDYRLSYELSNDYWMFTRWSKYTCSEYPVLIIGDSVIWGQYVKRDHALSHYLSELAGENMFANMGVDGIHPAAMLGLVKYYGKDISNKGVILHLNPLWMSSKKQDLRGEEEFRFNHPRLVPQLIPNLACYRPSFTEIIGVTSERSVPFFSWVNHLRISYFENMDIQNWTIQNPYKNPLSAITLKIPIPENKPQSRPLTRAERRMRREDFPWVDVEESFQWYSFKKVIEILNSRNNNVFVLLGPFNPYILTEESLNRYDAMKDEMETWLKERGISYYPVPHLPTEDYADVSHPLKEGYTIIAKELFEMESFQKWMKSLELKGRSKNEW